MSNRLGKVQYFLNLIKNVQSQAGQLSVYFNICDIYIFFFERNHNSQKNKLNKFGNWNRQLSIIGRNI